MKESDVNPALEVARAANLPATKRGKLEKHMTARYVVPAHIVEALGKLADVQCSKLGGPCPKCGRLLREALSKIIMELDVE
jgi:hypothetical protein